MRKMKPQKPLLQLVMLALLSVVSVLALSSESFAALQCYGCHGDNATTATPRDTPPGSAVSYRNITTGAVKGNHQTHLGAPVATSTAADLMCARCHNNSGYTSSHRSGTITMKNNGFNFSTSGAYTGAGMTVSGTYLFKNQTSVPTLGSCSSVNCHFESVTPTWGAAPFVQPADCGQCHSANPTTFAHQKHLTAGGHANYTCDNCHSAKSGATAFQHATSAGNTGRNIDLTGSSMAGSTYTLSNFQYLPSQSGSRVTGRCNTIYCHSRGQSSDGLSATPAAYTNPLWNATGLGCSSCHQAIPTTGSHATHSNVAIDCANCHNGATSSTMTATTHVNTLINVDGSMVGTYSQGASSARGNGYGNCANTYCHSTAQNAAGGAGVGYTTATWGATGLTCGSCHKNMDTDATAPGNHVKHAQTAAIACAVCHSGYTETTSSASGSHADGNVNLSFTGSGAGTTYSQGLSSPAANGYGTCTTSACHSSGQAADGTATPLTFGTVTWGATGLTCGSCHKNMDTDATAPGSHVKHAQGTVNIACATCHNGYTETATNPATHSDGSVNLSFQGLAASAVYSQGATSALGNGYGNCSTTYCHSAGQASTGGAITAPDYVTVTWGAAALTCGGCHKNMDTDATAPGSHVKHAQGTVNISCATCHNGFTETATDAAVHVNGNVNLAFSGNGAGTVYSQGVSSAAGNGYGSCSTSYCHSASQASNGGAITGGDYVTVTWGTAALGCGSCHKNMDTDPLATGGHVKHAQTEAIACATCHNGYTELTAAAATHVNNSINLAFSGAGAGTVYSQGANSTPGNGYGNCSTSACHSSGQAADGTASPLTYGTATWGGAALACGSCHKNMDTDATAPGSHVKHAQGTINIACATCHNGYTETTTSAATHTNGNVNLSFQGIAATAVYSQGTSSPLGNGYGNCTTTYCHSAGQAANGTALTAPNYVTVTWGAAALTCGSCHKNMDTDATATGTHTKHAQGVRNISCATCHNGYTETTVGATHIDQSINLGFSGAAASGVGTVYSQGNTHAAANGFGTCTTVCHNAPVSNGQFTAPAVSWGATLNCGGCHAYPPASSYHSAVLPGTCNGCHNSVAPGGTINNSTFDIPAQHMDGVVQGGKCNACHGYPPVPTLGAMGHTNNYTGARLQNYSGGGGVHAVAGHLALTIKPVDGFGTPGTAGACVTCHPSNSHNESAFGSFSTHHVQVVVDAKFKFDKNRPIVYNGVRSGASKTSGTCSNVECHFQKSPIWSTQTYTKGH